MESHPPPIPSLHIGGFSDHVSGIHHQDRFVDRSRGGVSASPAESNRRSIEFYIPRECAGMVIGPSGTTLKEIQTEFSCRIKIERDDGASVRKVFVWSDDESVLQQVKDKIIYLISGLGRLGGAGNNSMIKEEPSVTQIGGDEQEGLMRGIRRAVESELES